MENNAAILPNNEPVITETNEDDFDVDAKGNFIQKKAPAAEPKQDLKSVVKSEFDSAKVEVLDNKKLIEPKTEEPKLTDKKKYKIKYDGKEEEIEAGEQEIIDALQKSKDYTKKTQQAAEARKEADTIFKLMDNMKKDPNSLFDFAQQYLGHNIEQIAEQRLLEKMKYELMPEHERQAYDLTKENSQLKMELDKRTQAEKAEEQAEADAKALQKQTEEEDKYTAEIGEFFDSKGITPTTEQLISTLEIVLRYWDTPTPLSIEQAWTRVNGREQSLREQFLKTLKPEDLSEEIKKSLRQADVDRIKNSKPWQNSPKKEPSIPRIDAKKPVSSEEYFKKLGESFK